MVRLTFCPRNVDVYLTEARGVTSPKFLIRLLKLLDDSVLRRIFLPKRKEVMGDWRKFHETTLPALVLLANICNLWLLVVLLKVKDCTAVRNFSISLRQSSV